MSKLQEFREESNSIRQNRILFDWLADDQRREEFYKELGDEGFPVLKFKSLLRSGNDVNWPNQDVYLLSKKADVDNALQRCSVKPYAEFDKGARFMLGLDAGIPHTRQNCLAARALQFTADEIACCASVAFVRASILPLKKAGG